MHKKYPKKCYFFVKIDENALKLKKLLTFWLICGIMYSELRKRKHRNRRSKEIKKVLDKPKKMWYNKDTR